MKTSTKLGVALTVVWLLGVVFVLYCTVENSNGPKAIDLANFVAYSCSIPALVWLIIGYYRQGQELQRQEKNFGQQLTELKRQNRTLGQHRTVMRTQARELKAQAQHTQSLAELAEQERKRIEARERRQAEPILFATLDQIGTQQVKTTFINRGGEMRELEFQPGEGNHLTWSADGYLGANASADLTLVIGDDGQVDYPVRFSITCLDGVGNSHTLDFERMQGDRPWKQVQHARGQTDSQ